MCMGNLSQKIYCEMFFQKTMFGVVEKNSWTWVFLFVNFFYQSNNVIVILLIIPMCNNQSKL
jgi:hypothetical protein